MIRIRRAFISFAQVADTHPIPFVGYGLGLLLGLWAGIHPLVQILIILMAADIATGLMSAFVLKRVNTNESFVGLLKKTLILILCGIGHLVSDGFHMGFDLGSAVAGFYCAHELISIIENCKKAGIPIPGALMVALNKAKSLADIGNTETAVAALTATHKAADVSEKAAQATKEAEKKVEELLDKGPDQ
jgi:toxin secretion/phage lysis holin